MDSLILSQPGRIFLHLPGWGDGAEILAGVGLAQSRALGFGVEGVKQCCAAHEETVALGTAKAEIGHALGSVDFSDHFTVRRIDSYTVPLTAAHAETEIPIPIAPNPFRFIIPLGPESGPGQSLEPTRI